MSDQSDRMFLGVEDVRDRYNDNEVDAFMRLLAIRPHTQWQDKSTHHYKLGVHRYEDEGQELDPAFHTLSEIERKHADEETTKEWRSGTEVRFQVGNKKVPQFIDYRF